MKLLTEKITQAKPSLLQNSLVWPGDSYTIMEQNLSKTANQSQFTQILLLFNFYN